MSEGTAGREAPQIVHLVARAPHLSGSYNRRVGTLIDELPEYRQRVLCTQTSEPVPDAASDREVEQLGVSGLSVAERLLAALPAPLRARLGLPFGDRESQVFAWQAARRLRALRPRVVMVYDNHKLGPVLRRAIDWPCRLVLHQHGLSYFLSPAQATRDLSAFDAVVLLHPSSFHFDRARSHQYLPDVHVLPNFVDTAEFAPPSRQEKQALRAELGLPADVAVVLSLGRLVPKKGPHRLLRDWREVVAYGRRALLWIVGDGPADYRRGLESMARELGVADSVRFDGAVAPERTARCYAACDLFVLPSLCHEGQPLTLLEALATGVPCIASDYPGLGDCFPESCVEPIAIPNHLGAFVPALSRLLDDPHRRDAMGAAGRALCVEEYSLARGLDRWRRLYDEELRMAVAFPGVAGEG
ncbi:MAG: glycosyltransferase family 1 protein [Acidobacteria bacterium]|nr:MAG: glycosyltransferase family 1 protein [Acidobacteriota bacterium]REK08302.1 MAG: glycosyltransferase family 1 protein [Acidobacteriota bacterium]